MATTYDQLMEMGFTQDKIIQAIECTHNGGIEVALEWIMTHESDEVDVPTNNLVTSESTLVDIQINEGDQLESTAKSMKCDDCGKLLSTEMEMQNHASRLGHVNFSESIEEIQPLTPEEKQKQVERLQEKLKQKRLEREAQEEKDNLEREKNRRKQGRNIIDAKIKFEEDEMKRLAEQKRREKEEDRLYREKLKNQIASDREAKKQGPGIVKSNETSTSKPSEIKPVAANYDSCRIQIRHSQGSQIVETFSANDSLFKVALFLSEKVNFYRLNEIEFRTAMPSKLYGEEYMGKTLKELGFCPSIVLMATVRNSSN